ncbi:MAG TPA: CARDB domain-containing protein, partial [Planctomycetota bacterium]|nr:CARDB domain-containing protein [Planctomycetota bacterium]
RAGLDARTFELTHHTVPEVFYDGGWHMFDPTTRTFYIGSDNRSVASVRELEQHTELMKRAGASQRDLSFYDPPGNNRLGGHNGRTGWRMDVTLRPGESLTRKTFQDGPSLWDYEINRNKRYASGSLAWRPDLNRGKPDEFLKARSNLAHSPDNPPALRPKAPRVGAHAVFNVTSPYPITKATLTGTFGKAAEGSTFEVFITAYAPGMTTWRRRVITLTETGLGIRTLDLTPFVFGTYAYDVEFQMISAAPDESTGIHMIAFENTLQLNRYALPQLTGGENRVTYTDDGDARDVTVTFNFEEKHPLRPAAWPPKAGRENTLRAFVRNAGTEPARNVEVLFEELWRREPLKKTVVIDRIDPGGVGVAEVPWTPTVPRATWFRVTADPDGKTPETDEKNNTFTRGLPVLGAADVSVTPSQIVVETRDGRAHLEALLVNTGGLAAHDVEVAFLTGDGDTGKVIARTTVPVIHSRAFTSERIDYYGWARAEVAASALTGTHVGVKVDPERKLDDARRTNNTAWVEAARAARRSAPDEPPPADPLVFLSFEPEAGELSDLETRGALKAQEVAQHATHGKQAVRLTFPAGTEAALRIPYDGTDVAMPRSWEGRRALRLDAFNDTGDEVSLVVQLTTLKPSRSEATAGFHFRLPPRKPITLELDLRRLADLADLRAVESLVLMPRHLTRPEAPP